MERTDEDYLGYRLALALERRPILSWTAIQHRLCEVGSRRMDPRRLRQELSGIALDTGVISRTHNGLYASARPKDTTLQIEADAHLERLHNLTLDHEGRPHNSEHDLATMANVLADHLRGQGRTVHIRHIAQSADTMPTVTLHVIDHDRNTSAAVLVSCSVDWLYPDSPTLWKHLAQAHSLWAGCLLLMRRVAPTTFPLLSVFNARALQYYSLMHTTGPSATAEDVAVLGLPPLLPPDQLSLHTVMTQLERWLARTDRGEDGQVVSDLLNDAIDAGFADATPSIAQLTAWAQRHDAIPRRWTDGLMNAAIIAQPPGRGRAKLTPPPSSDSASIFDRETHKQRVPFRV